MAKRIFREITDDGTKWKMSLRKQGNLNPTAGKPRPEDVKKRISDSMKRYWQLVPSINDEYNNKKNKPK